MVGADEDHDILLSGVKMIDFKQITQKLPSRRVLSQFSGVLDREGSQEVALQDLIDRNPELFTPLELREFTRHLRFLKRNKADPAQPPGPFEVRIPDFSGVRLVPIVMPVIVEVKPHNARILDSSTLSPSTLAREVIGQLQTATMHLLRPAQHHESGKLRDFRTLARKVVDSEILAQFDRLDAALAPGNLEAQLIRIMHRLLDQGIGIFALIGHSAEFEGRQDIAELARRTFARQGCILVTCDELLLMNQVLCDYSEKDSSLLAYFTENRTVELHDRGRLRFGEHILLSRQRVHELQQKIHRLPGDVCIFGFGGPPLPSHPQVSYRVNTSFDIGMVWSQPTHLKGEERLIWAGRSDGRWLVVNQRLTGPLVGGFVWYEFSPPVEEEPIFHYRVEDE